MSKLVPGGKKAFGTGSDGQRRSARFALALAFGSVGVSACNSSPEPVGGDGGAGGSTNAIASGASAGVTSRSGSTAGNGGDSSSPCTAFGSPVAVGKAEPTDLTNLSGLVASRSQPGVYFAHPDVSGAIIYALQQSGASMATYILTGVTALDCEDIAIGPGPDSANTLYLGDFGDNLARPGTGLGRSEIQIIRVAEPAVPTTPEATLTALTNWQILRFKYPDRTHDAETLMVDPQAGDLFVVTREADGSAFVFTAPGSTVPGELTTLTQVAIVQVGASGANAGDISPAGDLALIRTYEAAWLYLRRPGSTWQQAFATTAIALPVANELQSEGATFSADGRAWLSSGEDDPTIYMADATCP